VIRAAVPRRAFPAVDVLASLDQECDDRRTLTRTSGNPPNTFHPDDPINWAEVSKIIAVAVEL
jgi:hypothetical protein